MLRATVLIAAILILAPERSDAIVITSGHWEDRFAGHSGTLAGDDFVLVGSADPASNHTAGGFEVWFPGQTIGVHAVAVGSDLSGGFTYQGHSFSMGCAAPNSGPCNGSAFVSIGAGPFVIPAFGEELRVTLAAPFTVSGSFQGYGPGGLVASDSFIGNGVVTLDLVRCINPPAGSSGCWELLRSEGIRYTISAPTPEPSTLMLVGSVIATRVGLRRWRHAKPTISEAQ
jgi:PEP-CTERM motif-containing protein